MKENTKIGSELRASAIGAGIGLLAGGVMGALIAVITASLSSGEVWFMILHVAFALMLMGLGQVHAFFPTVKHPAMRHRNKS